MKIKQWLSLPITAFAVFSFASCQDWGEMDSPAGNQVYPKLEKLANYTFDKELDPETVHFLAYEGGQLPVIVNDKDLGSKVLSMDGGYVRIDNPLNKVKVQNGVSLTFWMKQEDNSEKLKASGGDLEGALFSFQDETGTQKVFFTANGWLNYSGVDGDYEVNNPAENMTGAITGDEWHYVALTVRNDGYSLYVDGEEKINLEETEFDFSKIVQFMASAPNFYIGYGSDKETDAWKIDDLTIYRNQITESQIKVPEVGGGDTNAIIVGNEDRTTGWWSAFSDLVKAKGDQTIHFGFKNYSSGGENWQNWLIVLTNGKDRGESGYAEYFVLRADAYGWGDSNYNGGNITHNYNFDNGVFKNEMKDAYVDLTLKRVDNRIDMTAIVTTSGGTVYTYKFFYEGITTEEIGAFLTVEGAYLAIDPEAVYVGESYAPGSYLVGPADKTAGWWSYFSNFSKIKGNTIYPFGYTFINNTNGGANWNNWVLVVTNGKDRGETGYAEYFVLRADAYGWGDSNYKGENISNGFDFDSFTTHMKGATCLVTLTRNANRIDMVAKITTADGLRLPDYTFYYEGAIADEIGAFLTLEGASLDMRAVASYPFLNKK